MMQETEGVSLQPVRLVPIVICACISVFFMNFGLLSVFFMAPLAYAVLVYNRIWSTFIITSVINAVFNIITGIHWTQTLYLSTLFLCIVWIMGAGSFGQVRTLYRIIAAAAAGFLAFVIFIIGSRASGFHAMLTGLSEVMSGMFSSSGGAGAARNSMRELMSPEKIAQMSEAILLRGGIVCSMFFLFFINRLLAQNLAWFIKRRPKDRDLIRFYAPPAAIWVLFGSLAFILMTRMIKTEILQIIAWNVFVICAIMYFAQGVGIVIHFLQSKSSGFRMFINVLIVILIFSPLSVIAAAAILLLGIIENWKPFRREQGTGNREQGNITPFQS